MIQRLTTAGESEHDPNESKNVYIHPPFLSTPCVHADCARNVRSYTDFSLYGDLQPVLFCSRFQCAVTNIVAYLDHYVRSLKGLRTIINMIVYHKPRTVLTGQGCILFWSNDGAPWL